MFHSLFSFRFGAISLFLSLIAFEDSAFCAKAPEISIDCSEPLGLLGAYGAKLGRPKGRLRTLLETAASSNRHWDIVSFQLERLAEGQAIRARLQEISDQSSAQKRFYSALLLFEHGDRSLRVTQNLRLLFSDPTLSSQVQISSPWWALDIRLRLAKALLSNSLPFEGERALLEDAFFFSPESSSTQGIQMHLAGLLPLHPEKLGFVRTMPFNRFHPNVDVTEIDPKIIPPEEEANWIGGLAAALETRAHRQQIQRTRNAEMQAALAHEPGFLGSIAHQNEVYVFLRGDTPIANLTPKYPKAESILTRPGTVIRVDDGEVDRAFYRTFRAVRGFAGLRISENTITVFHERSAAYAATQYFPTFAGHKVEVKFVHPAEAEAMRQARRQ